jgi:hypothetical protein
MTRGFERRRSRSASRALAALLALGTAAIPAASPVFAQQDATASAAQAVDSARRAAPPARESTDLGGIVATASASPQIVEVGQAIEVRIDFEGEAARSIALELPESAQSADSPTLGDFDILALRGPTVDASGRATVLLSLASYDAGDAVLPALKVSWKSDGASNGARTEGEVTLPTVRITSLVGAEADPSKFRDIQGEVDVPRILRWGFAAGIAAIVLALAAVALWLVLRKRPVVVLAPHEWAHAELARIEREALASRGDFGRYYDELTAVVRGYVSRRFAIPADRQTSREFVAAAQSHAQFPSDETARLRELLRLADLVKFASAQPERAQCDAHLAQAREFVERTKPRPEAATESAGAAANSIAAARGEASKPPEQGGSSNEAARKADAR